LAKRIYNRYETRVYRTLVRYLNIICAMKQNKKKRSFLSSKGNFGTTFFILSLSGNVLKFAINVGGWKQKHNMRTLRI
jgi:hypothetical protein